MSWSDFSMAFSQPPSSVGWTYLLSSAAIWTLLCFRVSPSVSQYLHISLRSRNHRDLPSSRRFSSYMPGARTTADPRESRLLMLGAVGRCLFSLFPPGFPAVPQYLDHGYHSFDSSVLASVSLTTSPSALLLLPRLKSLQGSAVTPLAYKILCVRFVSVVRVNLVLPSSAPSETQHSIRVGS
jgi:hypothetical protein